MPSDDTDPKLKNCYVETTGAKNTSSRWVVKRPGLAANDTTAVAEGRGMATWKGNTYAIVGNKVYKNGVGIAGTLNTSVGKVYIDQAEDGTGLLCFHDGADIYTVNVSDTLTTLADVNIPTAMLPGIAVLDQYLFVATNDVNNEIHNSNVGDVTTWSSDFIVSEVSSDAGVAMAKYINYIVSLNEKTTEFFFDAANINGTPLQRFEGMVALIGCAGADTVANIDQHLYWVAKSPDGGRFIAVLKGSFTPERISTQAIDEYLEAEGASISDANGFHIRNAGHNLYVLNLPTVADKTFVYDIDENLWYEWTSTVTATETHFTGMASAEKDGNTLILDEDNGRVYAFEPTTYQDNTGATENILVEVNTARHDSNVQLNKFVHRLYLVGDKWTTPSTPILVSWSDDDYQTFVPNRSLDLGGEDFITRLGFYRRRSWRIQFVGNAPMRLLGLDIDESHGYYGR
jgi:hypothetical protein